MPKNLLRKKKKNNCKKCIRVHQKTQYQLYKTEGKHAALALLLQLNLI